MNPFRTSEVHTLFHAMLCVSDVTDKCNRWLGKVTFDWQHIMMTAVEHNDQTCRLITFLCRLFYKVFTKLHKYWTKSCKKTKYKYKKWIPFFCCSSKYKRNGSCARLMWSPLGITYFAWDPLRSYFDEQQKNEIYFLNITKLFKHKDNYFRYPNFSDFFYYILTVRQLRSDCSNVPWNALVSEHHSSSSRAALWKPLGLLKCWK